MEREFLVKIKQPNGVPLKDLENYIKVALKTLRNSVEFYDPLIKLDVNSIEVEPIGERM